MIKDSVKFRAGLNPQGLQFSAWQVRADFRKFEQKALDAVLHFGAFGVGKSVEKHWPGLRREQGVNLAGHRGFGAAQGMLELFGVMLDAERQLDGLAFANDLFGKTRLVLAPQFLHQGMEIQQERIGPGSVLEDVANARKALVGKTYGGKFLSRPPSNLRSASILRMRSG